MPWPLLCCSRPCPCCWRVFHCQLQRRCFGFRCLAPFLRKLWHHSVEFHGLFASHFNFGSKHGCVVSIPFLSRNMQSYFSATDGQVDSIYVLHRHNVMTWLRRVVSTPRLHWKSACLELSLYIIIEPTRSQVRAAQMHLGIADDYTNGCAGGEGSRSATGRGDPSQQSPSMSLCIGGEATGMAIRMVSPGGAVRQRGTARPADEPGL